MDKAFIKIKATSKNVPSKFYLFVHQGYAPSIFAVDGLDPLQDKSGKVYALQGWLRNPIKPEDIVTTLDTGVVLVRDYVQVEFPVGTSYTLIKRELVSLLSAKQMKKLSDKHDKELTKLGLSHEHGLDEQLGPGQYV